jgi:methyl halide transferase
MNAFECNKVDWDDRYQIGDTPWEKGSPAPPLLEWISAHGPLAGKILVPGPGLGHDVRAIASASPDAEVIGLDISPTAVDRASRFPRAGSEAYQLGDLFNLPAEFNNRFDWVFEHTCFCAIAPKLRTAYVRAVSSALKPNGFFLAIFFLNPWDPDEFPENGGPPFGATLEGLERLFSGAFRLLETMNPLHSYPGREGREIVQLLQKRISV